MPTNLSVMRQTAIDQFMLYPFEADVEQQGGKPLEADQRQLQRAAFNRRRQAIHGQETDFFIATVIKPLASHAKPTDHTAIAISKAVRW